MTFSQIKTVAVVGTGTIGASWAYLFLSRGLDVIATDISEGAEERLKKHIEVFRSGENRRDDERDDFGKLKFTCDVEEACRAADFVQENAVERLSEKTELIRKIDAVAPSHAIIASSSSAISVTDMQSQCLTPQRVILGHPFNPPHLIPLVELAGGEKTSKEVLDVAGNFYTRMGKIVVHLENEIFGHIANRLQAALFREAIYILDSGVASADDIDRAVSEGPGLRWALMGPFLTYHLAGGRRGMEGFWEMFSPMQEKLWNELGDISPTTDLQGRVIDIVEGTYRNCDLQKIAKQRDLFLQRLLEIKKCFN